MKITLITPYFSSLRGNAISIRRLVSGLQERGLDIQVISLETQRDLPLLHGEVLRFKPDLIHGIHAYRSGRIAVSLSKKL